MPLSLISLSPNRTILSMLREIQNLTVQGKAYDKKVAEVWMYD